MSDHYVVAGLSRSRQQWFGELARWATMAVAPIEFLKCLSVDETLALLGSGRRVSVLLVDAGAAGLDRDLFAQALDAGAAVVVVDDGRTHRDWHALGAADVLAEDFDRAALLDALRRHGAPVERTRRRATRAVLSTVTHPIGRVLSVVSSGGAGASTVAMAVAQGAATVSTADADEPAVALVDGASRADLAMLHDVGDVLPGLPELVEAHRHDDLDPGEIRALLYGIVERNYALLLGRRQPRDWTAMPPRSVSAALDGLTRTYRVVVVDHDPDLDGERETGSIDVEEMHALARTAVERADLVLAVGTEGTKGTYDLVRLVEDLLAAGVPPERIQPVVNRASRSPANRLPIERTLRSLVEPTWHGGADTRLSPPVFLPRLRGFDHHRHLVGRLPDSLVRPLIACTRSAIEDAPRRKPPESQAPEVEPGELGVVDEPVRFGSRTGAA